MLNDKMKALAVEFGFLQEDVEQDIGDQIKRAGKLDEVETVTFGLETDDGKIVKVFVNEKDAEKFEQMMADALGETDSIEDAINKAAAEIDIVDVEWPDEDEGSDDAEEEDDGSSALDSKVYGDKEGKGGDTQAKKSEPKNESLTVGEEFAAAHLYEDQGAISSRLTTPNQQLIYQAVLDLGVPATALDRSPYRAAIIKGMKEAAQELQGNGSAKTALKTFIKKRIEEPKAEKKEAKPVKESAEASEDDAPVTAMDPVAKPGQVVISQIQDGMMITKDLVKIELDLEQIEQIMKSIAEKVVAVVGNVTISPRGSNLVLKVRGKPEQIEMNAPALGDFKDVASTLLGLSEGVQLGSRDHANLVAGVMGTSCSVNQLLTKAKSETCTLPDAEAKALITYLKKLQPASRLFKKDIAKLAMQSGVDTDELELLAGIK